MTFEDTYRLEVTKKNFFDIPSLHPAPRSLLVFLFATDGDEERGFFGSILGVMNDGIQFVQDMIYGEQTSDSNKRSSNPYSKGLLESTLTL